MANHDMIIRNGLVFDGSGAPGVVADVAIDHGLISAIGTIEGQGRTELDARGKIVTPGFVDVHTHYDGQATWDSHMKPSSNLGATTVVMGNCGVGFAPCRAADHEVLVELMEGVEEIPAVVMAEGLEWNWETFPEYLDALDARPRDIDVAAFVPHGPLRVYAMGQRGANREPATAADIETMKGLLAEGVAAGGLGLSSSRTLLHLTSTGKHVPTFETATSEMKQLGEVLSGEQGHVVQFLSDFKDAEDEFSILTDISAKTGAKGTFTLLPFELQDGALSSQKELWKQHLTRLETAQKNGLDIRGQVITRPVGILMGHTATMSPFYRRPTFVKFAAVPWPERAERLRAPEIKAAILAEENDSPHIFVQLLSNKFEMMFPMEYPIDYLPGNDRSVASLAARDGQDPLSWLYDFFLGNDGQNLIYIPGTSKNQAKIAELLEHPHTLIALGDGGAHVGSICDSSANLYLLIKWVQEEQLFDLATGIRMLTREPAEFFSLMDRGLLAPGMKADVNILDLDRLALHTPHLERDLPGGGSRFLQKAEGIEATIKSGQLIFANGEATGALPGKLLRGAQAA